MRRPEGRAGVHGGLCSAGTPTGTGAVTLCAELWLQEPLSQLWDTVLGELRLETVTCHLQVTGKPFVLYCVLHGASQGILLHLRKVIVLFEAQGDGC